MFIRPGLIRIICCKLRNAGLEIRLLPTTPQTRRRRSPDKDAKPMAQQRGLDHENGTSLKGKAFEASAPRRARLWHYLKTPRPYTQREKLE
jgi:hypothetical protein